MTARVLLTYTVPEDVACVCTVCGHAVASVHVSNPRFAVRPGVLLERAMVLPCGHAGGYTLRPAPFAALAQLIHEAEAAG